MNFYSECIKKLSDYSNIESDIKSGKFPIMISGLSSIHKSHFIFSIQNNCFFKDNLLVITADESTARKIVEDINAMAGSDIAMFYPSRDLIIRDIGTQSYDYEHLRLGILARVLTEKSKIIVAPVEAATQYVMPVEVLKSKLKYIKVNQEIKLESLVETLVESGYVKRAQVDGVAQFSVRGGIIDYFPPHSAMPIRIDLFDNIIDNICFFDLDTQRRLSSLNEIKIYPVREVILDNIDNLTQNLIKLKNSYKHNTSLEKFYENIKLDIEKINNRIKLTNLDKYISLIYPIKSTLFSYFVNKTTFILENHDVNSKVENIIWHYNRDIEMLLETGEIVKELSNYCLRQSEFNKICDGLDIIYMNNFCRGTDNLKLKSAINIKALQNSDWNGELKLLIDEIQSFLARDYCCVIVAGTDKSSMVLAQDLQSNNIPAMYYKIIPNNLDCGKVYVCDGNLSYGFEYPDLKFTLITNSKIKKQRKLTRKRKGEEIRSLSDISVGDLVVHISHGIGIFDGINKLDLHGVVKDYIKIKYAGSDKLYVPVTQLDLVSKYIGPREDIKVKLNKLNSGEWQKTRIKVRKAVDDMAVELIKLYSKRMQTKGISFRNDDDLQKDFEAHFPYEETDDQLKCITEIKEDMQKQFPMDRVLCGDVGFGKTEVALRAAFKCVLSNKQCAILCPTTILALQHYQNISKRMGDFPVKVELLSRFRNAKSQKEIIKQLSTGEIDIIVGTHRLVQKDIFFKDLGLAIIDEEQRFGVSHKEKFKDMFIGVDVLTLSATPIPRTLNMAMSGIRDMSTIDEPPQDRYPIQTYVLEYDLNLIMEAIKTEIRRNGQVYYIYNRIDTINECAARIIQNIPDARVGVAHGRMTEIELSKIWKMLMEGELDILVCTTIIETGVDIANCNTLIIENADKMGLSQLYQLRGRIGRSNRRAFAYFTFAAGKVLSEIAIKRLEAIREFTQFGSGFKIALRDLEIRGAGNILGSRQHGHMEAVGYDMYLRLLSDSISAHKGDKTRKKMVECVIDIQIEAHIPDEYIGELSQRIEVYRKIASVRTSKESYDLIDELIDRFGDPPNEVQGLINVALLRNTASYYGFYEINQKRDSLLLYMDNIDMELIGFLVSNLKSRIMVNAGNKPYISVKINQDQTSIDAIREVMTLLQNKLN